MRVIAVVALWMAVAPHVGRRTMMLLFAILRLALILRMLDSAFLMLRRAVIWMALVVRLIVVIMIPFMMLIPVIVMLLIRVVVPALVIVMIWVMIVPVVMMALVPVSSVMPPVGMMIPIGVLATPTAVALFWMAIAVTEIRVIFRVVVTIVVTLGMAEARD
jgi:hypothetical protein